MEQTELDRILVGKRTHACELGKRAGNAIANIANIPGWDDLTPSQKVERAQQNIAIAESEMRRLREIGHELLMIVKGASNDKVERRESSPVRSHDGFEAR